MEDRLFTFEDLEKRRPRKTEDTYEQIRHKIKTGDIIAFGGYKRTSHIIKLFTRGAVSHVGMVVDFEDGKFDGRNIMLIEATSLNGSSGVQMKWLSHVIFGYIGETWWLSLSNDVRNKMNEKKLKMFLRNQIGKPYDTIQAIRSGIDGIGPFKDLFENEEDFSQLFCSELVMAALEASGAIPEINSSEVTPIEVCRYNIYKEYLAIRGNKPIKGFNTRTI